MHAAVMILSLAWGHELPDGVVQRGLQVVVRAERLEFRYQVGMSPDTARQQLRQWGVAFDPAAPVFPIFRTAALKRLHHGLTVQLDGVSQTLQPVSVKEVRRHHARVECLYELPAPTWDGRLRRLEVRDTNFPAMPGPRQVAIKGRDDLVVVSDAPPVLGRDAPQPWSELSPRQRERSRRLQAWIGAPGDQLPFPLWTWLVAAGAGLAPLRLVLNQWGPSRQPRSPNSPGLNG